MGAQTDGTVRSVDISCTIIEELQDRGWAGVSELAASLGHSKSTVHDHLTTLQKNQFVVQENGEYRLSLRFLELAQHVKEQHGHYSIIQQTVDELAEETGERAQFGSEDFGKLTYMSQSRGSSDIDRRFRPGAQEFLHCTALGKAILAFLPRDRVDEMVERYGLTEKTQNTITDYEELVAELETIRERKYAVDDEELATGLRCVAAPVTGDDVVIGAIGVSGPISRFDDDRIEGDLATQVKRMANVIEINSMFSE